MAKALDIYAKTGKALQGWNDNVNKDAAYEFYTRFLPLLGNNYTVYNAMVVARNGTRDAGYTCNPGFYGDLNYIGNSW